MQDVCCVALIGGTIMVLGIGLFFGVVHLFILNRSHQSDADESAANTLNRK